MKLLKKGSFGGKIINFCLSPAAGHAMRTDGRGNFAQGTRDMMNNKKWS